MPPLGFSDAEVAAMATFLREMDRTEIGRGELRLGTPGEGAGRQAAFERAIEAAIAAGEVGFAAGFAAYRTRPCSACHFPFRDSPVGAPDLSLVAGSLAPDSLDQVLAEGRPLKGMPPPVPPLDAADRAARLTRVLVSDMIRYHRDRYDRALERGTLREDFAEEVRRSWSEYVRRVGEDLAHESRYFQDELNATLARGEQLF